MNKKPQYRVLIGIGILTIVVLVLVFSPEFIFSPTVTVIGSDMNKSSSHEASVTTKTDLSNPEQMAAFPKDIGQWHGRDYDTASVTQQLGANIVLMRGYDPETFAQPLFLTIVQSRSDSSFHSPDIYCYPSQGYVIQENAKEDFLVTNATWPRDHSSISLPLNKLVVAKNTKDGQIFERRVVLFFYMKGNQFYSDMITMVETQALVPLQGSYEGTLKEEKLFLSEIAPFLFQPAVSSEWNPLIKTLIDQRPGGYLIIAVLFLVPLAVIFSPRLRRKGVTQ